VSLESCPTEFPILNKHWKFLREPTGNYFTIVVVDNILVNKYYCLGGGGQVIELLEPSDIKTLREGKVHIEQVNADTGEVKLFVRSSPSR
jgi:hypothetical protein